MTWKINYWTVLFALTIFGIIYNSCTSEATPKEVDNSASYRNVCLPVSVCDTVNSNYVIEDSIALRRINAYAKAMYAIQEELTKNKYPLPVDSLVMHHVQLPRCELYQMLCQIPDGDVYIYPTMERDTVNGRPTMVFSTVFGDSPHYPGKNIVGNMKFFNFGKPCPNFCPEK